MLLVIQGVRNDLLQRDEKPASRRLDAGRPGKRTGLGASAWRDLPTGASVVFALGTIFLACAIVYAPTVSSSLMEICRHDKKAMRRVRTLDRG